MREPRADTSAGRVKLDEATTPPRAGGGRARGAAPTILALQRTVGNRATARLLRQPAPARAGTAAPTAVPAASRRRLVFLMGRDARGFYHYAERFWRVREPNATFVTTARSLADIIDWMNANVTNPVGRIYIVSHANEDGTLSFGVDSQDQDHHMPYVELRDALHPPDGSASTLPRLRNNQADDAIIDIKGCNIGRSPAMLDLLKEAFGGRASVYAPMHEQVYGYDGWIAEQARLQAESLIRSEAERSRPLPDAVDPRLTGAARTRAVRERARLMAERDRAIAAEVRARRPEVDAEMEAQGTFEALSGPEVQQAGTAAIAASEIRAEVDRLYPHLSDRQRAQLTRELVRAQRVQSIRPMTYTLARPTTVAHVNRFWAETLAQNHFRVGRIVSVDRAAQGDRVVITVEVAGRFHEPGEPARDGSMTLTSETPSDAAIIAEGRRRVANPEAYEWDLEETAAGGGMLRRAARGRRMRGYLHHRSLDSGPHDHFQIEGGNLDYFGTSGLPPRRAAVGAP